MDDTPLHVWLACMRSSVRAGWESVRVPLFGIAWAETGPWECGIGDLLKSGIWGVSCDPKTSLAEWGVSQGVTEIERLRVHVDALAICPGWIWRDWQLATLWRNHGASGPCDPSWLTRFESGVKYAWRRGWGGCSSCR